MTERESRDSVPTLWSWQENPRSLLYLAKLYLFILCVGVGLSVCTRHTQYIWIISLIYNKPFLDEDTFSDRISITEIQLQISFHINLNHFDRMTPPIRQSTNQPFSCNYHDSSINTNCRSVDILLYRMITVSNNLDCGANQRRLRIPEYQLYFKLS